MKLILYIFLFLSLTLKAQNGGYSKDQLILNLSDLQMDLSIGNACGSGELDRIELPEDMDMNGHTIELMQVHLIVRGNLVDEGTFIYNCNNATLEIFGGTLSTNGNGLNDAPKIYPNPANDYINVKGEGINFIRMYDVFGRTMKLYKTIGNVHRINIKDLSDGVYYLRVNDLKAKKIIKR